MPRHYAIFVVALFSCDAVISYFLLYFVPRFRAVLMAGAAPIPAGARIVLDVAQAHGKLGSVLGALLLIFMLAFLLALSTARVEPLGARMRILRWLVVIIILIGPIFAVTGFLALLSVRGGLS